MDEPSDVPLAIARRRVVRAEGRFARQAAVAEGFEIAGDANASDQAKEMLEVLRVGLALARLCVLVELVSPDDGLTCPGGAGG